MVSTEVEGYILHSTGVPGALGILYTVLRYYKWHRELETLPSAERSMAQLSQKAQGLDLQTLKLTDAQVLCVTQYGEYSIRQLSSAIF